MGNTATCTRTFICCSILQYWAFVILRLFYDGTRFENTHATALWRKDSAFSASDLWSASLSFFDLPVARKRRPECWRLLLANDYGVESYYRCWRRLRGMILHPALIFWHWFIFRHFHKIGTSEISLVMHKLWTLSGTRYWKHFDSDCNYRALFLLHKAGLCETVIVFDQEVQKPKNTRSNPTKSTHLGQSYLPGCSQPVSGKAREKKHIVQHCRFFEPERYTRTKIYIDHHVLSPTRAMVPWSREQVEYVSLGSQGKRIVLFSNSAPPAALDNLWYLLPNHFQHTKQSSGL